MKYILILISTLFLSYPVIGDHHEGETLFLLGEYPNWKWIEFGDKKTHSKYQGQVREGKPEGLGVLSSTNGWKYFGTWNNGKIWNGTEYDNYGNIIYRWVEGKRKYHNFNVKYR